VTQAINFTDVDDKIITNAQAAHQTILDYSAPYKEAFLKDIDLIEGVVRQQNRIIYASSYDRGLESVLRNWKEVKTAVPNAELHIFYGWNTYDRYMKDGYIKDNGKWEKIRWE